MQRLHRNYLIALVLLLPAQLLGEGFTIQSNVDTAFQGGLGSVAGLVSRLSGQSLRNVPTTTYLQNHQLRIEDEVSATIYDLDAELVTTIDHKQKTYASTTFAAIRAAMEKALASAEEARAKEAAKAAKTNPDGARKNDKVNLKYHVQVVRLPHVTKDALVGYDAEFVDIIITLDVEATDKGQKAEQAGSMVFLLTERLTQEAALTSAYAEFDRLYAQKIGQAFRSQVKGLQSVFAADPRMKDGFEAAAKELAKLQGVSIQNVINVVLVPANVTFDRALAQYATSSSQMSSMSEATAEKSEKPKSGLRGFLGAIKSAAEDASKQVDKGNQNSGPPKQTTLVVITDQMRSIKKGAVPAATFMPPTGYRQVKPKA